MLDFKGEYHLSKKEIVNIFTRLDTLESNYFSLDSKVNNVIDLLKKMNTTLNELKNKVK